MEVIILYWLFSILFCVGVDVYSEKVSFGNILLAVLCGWFVMPLSLGSQRGKSLEE